MASIDQELDRLIVHGKFRQAHKHALAYLQDQAPEDGLVSAHVWFKLALTASLTGESPRLYREAARSAPGYTPAMEGDFLRDQMLAAIRKKHVKRAASLISEIEKWHRHDPNRLAALTMARARLAFARRDTETAWRLHVEADEKWRDLKERADRQWVRNNRFHLFKTLVATKRPRALVYRQIMADEPRSDRRLRLGLMHYFGRLGLALSETLERLKP